MDTNTPAIEFRNVSISFDEKQALDRISFKLERSEMIFITGAAGSGKSVLTGHWLKPAEWATAFCSIL